MKIFSAEMKQHCNVILSIQTRVKTVMCTKLINSLLWIILKRYKSSIQHQSHIKVLFSIYLTLEIGKGNRTDVFIKIDFLKIYEINVPEFTFINVEG